MSSVETSLVRILSGMSTKPSMTISRSSCVAEGSPPPPPPPPPPAAPPTLGRIINVTGDPIDERGPVKATKFAPIHADAPAPACPAVRSRFLRFNPVITPGIKSS
ncbi:unnamed protein product [Penicillium roqueforti FM164]|uniref:Genomic scaffold, ProqFM164S02 n=1 Tax=Penicillium roqueforti (strain FM164) TaxID=1365484 RepID=W6Q7I1_PENRF|nr:unnamed protein product [Penicillium roqueforti FM164]